MFFIVNVNDSIMRPAAMLRISDGITDRVRFAIPQVTEWQRIASSVMILAPPNHSDYKQKNPRSSSTNEATKQASND